MPSPNELILPSFETGVTINDEGVLRSGDDARAAGAKTVSMRCYGRRGLLPRPGRTSGGHRLYSSFGGFVPGVGPGMPPCRSR
jgi:hypothetical protein